MPGRRDRRPRLRLGATGPALLRLLAALFVVNLGKSITIVALPILVIERYGLGPEVANALALRLVPMMFGGVVSAWALSRFDPRWVAALAMCATGVATLFIPMTETTAQLNTLSIVSGVTSVFSSPALFALRAGVIPPNAVMKGNGFVVVAEKTPQVIGPAIAAGVLLFTSVSNLFYAEAVTTAAAALLLIGIPWPVGGTSGREGSGHGPMGWRAEAARFGSLIFRDPRLQAYVVTGLAYAVALSAGRILFAAIATSVFASNPSALPVMLSSMAVGAVAGGLFASRLSLKHVGAIYLAANLLEAAGVVGVGFSSSFGLTLALMLCCGLCESTATAAFFADVQVRLPGKIVGQFFALFMSGINACAVLGTMIAGWIVPNVSIVAGSWVIAGFIAVPLLLFLRAFLGADKGPTAP